MNGLDHRRRLRHAAVRVGAFVLLAFLSVPAGVIPGRVDDVQAQQRPAGKVYRIGFLSQGQPPKAWVEALQQSLRERGYAEGRNLMWEFRSTDGSLDQLPQFAEELVRLKVDAILARASSGAMAAKRATMSITIVFFAVYAPVEIGLVPSLGHPGGNVTGVADAVFACAVLQHLAAPIAALEEMRRVLKPGGVIGIVDGSSTVTIRHPTNPLLDKWDRLRALEREYTTGRPAEALPLRALLRAAGFTRTRASGDMATEAGPPAGSLEETRRVAQNHLIRLRGVLGGLAMGQGWTTKEELEQIAEALMAWGEDPDAFYARPAFTAVGWA